MHNNDLKKAFRCAKANEVMMASLTIIFYCLVGVWALKLLTELWLNQINLRHVRAHRSLPETFSDFITPDLYQKSRAYTMAKLAFDNLSMSFGGIVLGLFLFAGILPPLFNYTVQLIGESLAGQALSLILISILLSLPNLPFEWWSQFRIEARFGFNKSTQSLWIGDKIKGLMVGVVVFFPLIWALLYTIEKAGTSWWLWGFLLFVGFQLTLFILYPLLIMPLFNKFEPLKPGPLKDRLMALAKKTHFPASEIMVMDGSRRSTHSNAFFTGFGKFRRIVLFDTLVEQLEISELEAVLAHEIGHYKHGHVVKRLVLMMAMAFIAFSVLGYLSNEYAFYHLFGFNKMQGMVPAFILFMLLSGLFSFWLQPIFNGLSRRDEYEADAFACRAVKSPAPLIEALRKLYKHNLSNLTPHPSYSQFYYSHPTLIERESALHRLDADAMQP